MKDWPRIAKLQSDLLAQALGDAADARGVLHADQVPGPLALPVARLHRRRGITITRTPTARLRAPTAWKGSALCGISAAGTWRSSRTWSAKLKSIPEGDGTLLDHCCLLYVHEHAEANPHKNTGWR